MRPPQFSTAPSRKKSSTSMLTPTGSATRHIPPGSPTARVTRQSRSSTARPGPASRTSKCSVSMSPTFRRQSVRTRSRRTLLLSATLSVAPCRESSAVAAHWASRSRFPNGRVRSRFRKKPATGRQRSPSNGGFRGARNLWRSGRRRSGRPANGPRAIGSISRGNSTWNTASVPVSFWRRGTSGSKILRRGSTECRGRIGPQSCWKRTLMSASAAGRPVSQARWTCRQSYWKARPNRRSGHTTRRSRSCGPASRSWPATVVTSDGRSEPLAIRAAWP